MLEMVVAEPERVVVLSKVIPPEGASQASPVASEDFATNFGTISEDCASLKAAWLHRQ